MCWTGFRYGEFGWCILSTHALEQREQLQVDPLGQKVLEIKVLCSLHNFFAPDYRSDRVAVAEFSECCDVRIDARGCSP